MSRNPPFIVLLFLTLGVCGQLEAQSSDVKNKGDNLFKLPRAFFDFTVEVAPLKEDCFYQHVTKGTKMILAFEVLRGGDGKIGFLVRDPNHRILQNVYLRKQAILKRVTEMEDNTVSRFSSKLVFVELVMTKREDWDKYVPEIKHQLKVATSLRTSMEEVEAMIDEMMEYQYHASAKAVRDWYFVTDNNRYISYYSMAECVVIVVSSCLQVYVLRRFFSEV